MGTSKVITTSGITQLEADVNELKDKLNALVTQFNLLQSDMTTNANAIDAIELKVTGSYTAQNLSGASGSASDSILKRLQDLDSAITSIANNVSSGGSGMTRTGSSGTTTRLQDITGLTALSADNASSTSSASVTGSYSSDDQQQVTIGKKAEVRARQLARKTLNSLRN